MNITDLDNVTKLQAQRNSLLHQLATLGDASFPIKCTVNGMPVAVDESILRPLLIMGVKTRIAGVEHDLDVLGVDL